MEPNAQVKDTKDHVGKSFSEREKGWMVGARGKLKQNAYLEESLYPGAGYLQGKIHSQPIRFVRDFWSLHFRTDAGPADRALMCTAGLSLTGVKYKLSPRLHYMVYTIYYYE